MLDHKWAAWEKKENVMAYEIVCESESKRYRSDCASVLTKTCEILKSKNIIAQFSLVGSGAKNLITRNGNGPYDLDYNLVVIKADERYWKDFARVAEIGTELSDLQKVVGGLIEPYYPFEEQVCIVCNDEGKYNGMRPCRAIYGEDREMMDIIFGPFFICDCSTPYFGSLNKEQLERYTKQFQNPEHFFRVGGEIKAVPYKPERDHER